MYLKCISVCTPHSLPFLPSYSCELPKELCFPFHVIRTHMALCVCNMSDPQIKENVCCVVQNTPSDPQIISQSDRLDMYLLYARN